jgi:hypothetical protein
LEDGFGHPFGGGEPDETLILENVEPGCSPLTPPDNPDSELENDVRIPLLGKPRVRGLGRADTNIERME